MIDTRHPPDFLVGRFWLAGHEERSVPGRLTLGESTSPRLELDESLTPLLKELDDPARPPGTQTLVFADEGPEPESHVVHGVLDDGTDVTLADTLTVRRKQTRGLDRQWLKAQFALLGGHVRGSDERYTKVRLRLRHLDSWAALPGFTLEKLESDNGVQLTWRRSDSEPVELSNGGWLDIEQTPTAKLSRVRGGGIAREVWLGIGGLPPSTADDLDRRFVTPLSSLLTLATSADCPPVAVEVATGPDDAWLSVHHSGLRADVEEERPTYKHLLPLGALGVGRVATWLDTVEKLGALPPVVAAAVAGTGRTLETRLLELTTVAEGLHRRLFPDERRLTEDEAERARDAVATATEGLDDGVRRAVEGALSHVEDLSFPRRMEHLAALVAVAVPGVTGRTNRWKHCVTDVRNAFAHRSYGFLERARVPELIAVHKSLRWLLAGVLLLQTGVPPDELAARIEDHQPYILFRQQAREWLPRVFAAPADA